MSVMKKYHWQTKATRQRIRLTNFESRTRARTCLIACFRFTIHLSVIFPRKFIRREENFYRQMYRKLKVIRRSDSRAGEACKFCQ